MLDQHVALIKRIIDESGMDGLLAALKATMPQVYQPYNSVYVFSDANLAWKLDNKIDEVSNA